MRSVTSWLRVPDGGVSRARSAAASCKASMRWDRVRRRRARAAQIGRLSSGHRPRGDRRGWPSGPGTPGSVAIGFEQLHGRATVYEAALQFAGDLRIAQLHADLANVSK